MGDTTLTNPGIIDRLEQDITDYLSPFGFSIERHEIDEPVSSDETTLNASTIVVVEVEQC